MCVAHDERRLRLRCMWEGTATAHMKSYEKKNVCLAQKGKRTTSTTTPAQATMVDGYGLRCRRISQQNAGVGVGRNALG